MALAKMGITTPLLSLSSPALETHTRSTLPATAPLVPVAAPTPPVAAVSMTGPIRVQPCIQPLAALGAELRDIEEDYMASLSIARPPNGLCRSPPAWDGGGNAYLLHLMHAVHTIQPYLVHALADLARPAKLVLVGGSAWGAYTTLSLETDDMDFLTTVAAPDIPRLLHSAVLKTVATPLVGQTLAVLEAMSAATGAGRRATGVATHHFAEAIRVAEAAQRDPLVDYSGFLQVRETDVGWRIQVRLLHGQRCSNAPLRLNVDGADSPM